MNLLSNNSRCSTTSQSRLAMKLVELVGVVVLRGLLVKRVAHNHLGREIKESMIQRDVVA